MHLCDFDGWLLLLGRFELPGWADAGTAIASAPTTAPTAPTLTLILMLPPWGNWATSGKRCSRRLVLRHRLVTGLPLSMSEWIATGQSQELLLQTLVRPS